MSSSWTMKPLNLSVDPSNLSGSLTLKVAPVGPVWMLGPAVSLVGAISSSELSDDSSRVSLVATAGGAGLVVLSVSESLEVLTASWLMLLRCDATLGLLAWLGVLDGVVRLDMSCHSSWQPIRGGSQNVTLLLNTRDRTPVDFRDSVGC